MPELVQKSICVWVPKEFCHMKLDRPKLVRKPVTMKWCTFPDGKPQPASLLPEILPKSVADTENQTASFDLNLVNGPPAPLSRILENQSGSAEEVIADN